MQTLNQNNIATKKLENFADLFKEILFKTLLSIITVTQLSGVVCAHTEQLLIYCNTSMWTDITTDNHDGTTNLKRSNSVFLQRSDLATQKKSRPSSNIFHQHVARCHNVCSPRRHLRVPCEPSTGLLIGCWGTSE